MKKIIIAIIVLIVLALGFSAWKLLGPSLSSSDGEFLYIKTGSGYADVKQELISKKIIKTSRWFHLASKILRYKKIKPGRYKIKKDMSLFKLVRMLRSGDQTQVNFVITKIRTKEDFARKAGNLLECDSIQVIHFLTNNDSLKKFGLDTNTTMAALMPYTYSLNWNTTAEELFQKCYTAFKIFWTEKRKQKADSLHLTPLQVSILASIVEEETLEKADKPNIASVYINRIRAGMPLQADPTVKFAMKDFGLKRILKMHLQTISPYNTYLNTGLPPGPICSPSIETIDAVLDSPATNYMYFVASSNFDGSSIFTSKLSDHIKYAKEYQQALTKRLDSLNKIKPE